MKVDGSLKIGILCGLVEIKGTGEFLQEKTDSRKTARVALYFEKLTRIERLPMEVIEKIQYPEVFDQADATHVVVGIEYGAKAIFDFQQTFDTEKAKLAAGGSIKAQIDKIPKVSVGVGGGGKYESSELDKNEDLNCKYTGDFDLDKLPTNLEEAVHIYQDLPQKLSTNNSKAVPMVAWLLPISKISSKYQQTSIEIDKALLDKCIKLNEEMDELMLETNDLKSNPTVSNFPTLLERLKTFHSRILDPIDLTIKTKLK